MTDGIEIRGFGDGTEDVDEVVMMVGGRCVFHSESMGDDVYWFACYLPDGRRASFNLFVESGKLVCRVQDDDRTPEERAVDTNPPAGGWTTEDVS